MTLTESETPPQESKQPEKNVYIKKTLCKNIFSSDFFNMYEEDWFDVDVRDTRLELKNEYPDAFKFIYKEYKTFCISFNGNSCYSYRYENNYRMLPVSVGALHRDEYVFMCLTRDRRSRKIKQYYVSEEYDVSVLGTYPMAGRFIFAYNNDRTNSTLNNVLTLRGMAEESAVGWDFLSRFIEMYYVNERNADKPRPMGRRNNTGTAINRWNNDAMRNNANVAGMGRERSTDVDTNRSWIDNMRETTYPSNPDHRNHTTDTSASLWSAFSWGTSANKEEVNRFNKSTPGKYILMCAATHESDYTAI